MLRNYILIAWRNLVKNKLFSFINIFGLALSVSVCMIVLVRIVEALEYDNFHPEHEQIYRIISTVSKPQGENLILASSPLPLAQALQDNGIRSTITHFYPAVRVIAKDRSREFGVRGAFIEPAFFSVFGFTCRYGNAEKSLAEPNKVLLSQTTAEKFYGQIDPTGKTVTLGELGEFEVVGVVNTPPAKSHIDYDVFVSMASVPLLEANGHLARRMDNWNTLEYGYTYIRLHDGVSKTAEEQILKRTGAEVSQPAEFMDGKAGYTITFELQALDDITPSRGEIYNDIGRGPSLGSLLGEGGIAFIILLAACFNYTNLSVARALTRGKEVGIRKLSGAVRLQIIMQYVTEAIIIALFALLIANCIFGFILEFKPFNDGYELVPAVSFDLKLITVFTAFSIFCGLLAGAVPAWILSSFKPARILRGVGNEKLVGNLSFRKVLTVFQFSLSLVVLIFLTAFYQQFDFLGKADPGFNTSGIALIPNGDHDEITAADFERIPGIKKIGYTSGSFGNSERIKASAKSFDQEGFLLEQYSCSPEWLEMMQLTFTAGHNFQGNTDDVIVNEKAALALGFKNASDAVGSLIYLQDSIPVTISGVVKDFYAHGFGNAIQPLLMRQDGTKASFIAIQVQTRTMDLRSTLEAAWKKQNPDHVFEMRWLDTEMKKQNDQIEEISLLGFLGFITISIAALGLLGLVVYTVETRRKEISIRKIIGATELQVMRLLSGGFIKLLMLAGIIALPIGFVLSSLFLINFVNRISVGVIELGLCFAFLLTVGLVTILSQTWKASIENPSRNLRSE